MANQTEPGTMGSPGSGSPASHSAAATREAAGGPEGNAGEELAVPGGTAALGPYPAYHGRTVSWVAISIMIAGFLVGGLALIFGHHGPTWWLFWVGCGLSVLGLLAMLVTNTFEDWY